MDSVGNLPATRLKLGFTWDPMEILLDFGLSKKSMKIFPIAPIAAKLGRNLEEKYLHLTAKYQRDSPNTTRYFYKKHEKTHFFLKRSRSHNSKTVAAIITKR